MFTVQVRRRKVHIVPDLHIEEGGLPHPPVQLLVQDSDSLFERQ
jgi:hypothetical protein